MCFLAGLSPRLRDVFYGCSQSICTQWVGVCVGRAAVRALCATQKSLTVPRYMVAFLGQLKYSLVTIQTDLSRSTSVREDGFSS